MPVTSSASPCVKICTMDVKAGICGGCGRTLAEIAGWLSFSIPERELINLECERRLENLRRLMPLAI